MGFLKELTALIGVSYQDAAFDETLCHPYLDVENKEITCGMSVLGEGQLHV